MAWQGRLSYGCGGGYLRTPGSPAEKTELKKFSPWGKSTATRRLPTFNTVLNVIVLQSLRDRAANSCLSVGSK